MIGQRGKWGGTKRKLWLYNLYLKASGIILSHFGGEMFKLLLSNFVSVPSSLSIMVGIFLTPDLLIQHEEISCLSLCLYGILVTLWAQPMRAKPREPGPKRVVEWFANIIHKILLPRYFLPVVNPDGYRHTITWVRGGNGILYKVLQFVTFTEISSEIHIKILWTCIETEIFYGCDP